MKVLMLTRADNDLEDYDYCDAVEIHIDGNEEASFHVGVPEDNSLSRNFSDVYFIPDLMKMAYEAGKNGEELEIDTKDLECS